MPEVVAVIPFTVPSHYESDQAVRRFNQQMRAINACLAVLALADGPELIAELVMLWMTGRRSRDVTRLAKQIAVRVEQHWQQFQPQPYMPAGDDVGELSAPLDLLLDRGLSDILCAGP